MKTAIIAIFLLLASVTGCTKEPVALDVSGLKEASTSFDQENVAPFLARVASLFKSGFGSKEATVLADSINDLPIESTAMWEYAVSIDGKTERLVVLAFKDDVDTPDIYFYSSPAVADAIS